MPHTALRGGGAGFLLDRMFNTGHECPYKFQNIVKDLPEGIFCSECNENEKPMKILLHNFENELDVYFCGFECFDEFATKWALFVKNRLFENENKGD